MTLSLSISLSVKGCKVEFIQSFFWLYSVPSLLVIQHLENLYLGGNHVRAMCKKVWRKAQECEIKKSLATGSRDWLTIGKSPVWYMCKACRGSWRVTPVVALQDKTSSLARQLARDSNLPLILVTSSSCQNTLFSCNWLFAFHTHHTINTIIPMKCSELLERILREKP